MRGSDHEGCTASSWLQDQAEVGNRRGTPFRPPWATANNSVASESSELRDLPYHDLSPYVANQRVQTLSTDDLTPEDLFSMPRKCNMRDVPPQGTTVAKPGASMDSELRHKVIGGRTAQAVADGCDGLSSKTLPPLSTWNSGDLSCDGFTFGWGRFGSVRT